ncbi:MAG: Na+/H+ antiporter subunit E [Eubacteriales bacterium]|nr:Na+/H+ antiporter subunit E [Eubacteriales bacterium]
MEGRTKSLKGHRIAAIVGTSAMCFAAWILFTWSTDPKELITGAVVAIVVGCFTGRMLVKDNAFYFFNPIHFFVLIYYWFVVLFSEIVKANWDVAKRVFKRDMGVNPGVIRVPTKRNTYYGLAFLANAITLTPGTITMATAESCGENGEEEVWLYIHWLDVKTTDREAAGEMIKGRLEKWIGRI